MTTIGSLAYGISANTSNFTAGITASKAELRTLKDAFLASQSPVEKYSSAIAHLEDLAQKFPDKAAGLQGTIRKMREEMDLASKPTNGLTDLLGKMPFVIDPVSASFQAFHAVTSLAGNALRTLQTLVGGVSAEMGRLDEVAKKAQSLGIDASTLIGWQRAAEDLAGVSGETFTKAFQIINARIAEAASEGTGEAAKALERLGLSAGELSKMDVSEKMLAVADAMQKVENVGERSKLALQLLGKSGMDLAPMLAAGGDEIRKLMADQIQLSQIKFLDLESIQAANDALARVETVVTSIKSLLASDFAAITKTIADELTSGFQGATKDGEALRDTIRDVAFFTAALIDQARLLADLGSKFAGPLLTAIDLLLPKLGLLIDLMKALNMAGDIAVAPGKTLSAVQDFQEKAANRKPGQTAQTGIELGGDALEKQAKEAKTAADKASAALDRQNAERAAIDKLREQFQRDEQKDIIERIKQADEARADMQKKIESLKEKLATPAEKLAEELAKLMEMKAAGMDPALFDRGLADIKERGEKAAGLGDQSKIRPGLIPGDVRGSVAEFRSRFDQGGGVDEKQLKTQQEMREFLKIIAEKNVKADPGLLNGDNL